MEYRTPTEKFHANYPSAKKLVHASPDRAIELIAKKCDFDDINEFITIASHSSDNNAPIVNTRHGYSALHPPFTSASSTSSRHSASPKSPPPITSHFNHARGNPTPYPPSPPSTSSTGQSSTRPEYINVPVGGNLETKLSMRKVSTEHSVIRQSIVEERLRDLVNISPVQHGPIHTPYQGAPNGVLISYYQVQLTWRRDTSFKTHEAIFYIVQDDIDSDILLGEVDSGEGLTNNMGAQSRGQHGTTVTGQAAMNSPYPQRSVPTSFFPPAPEAPFPASYHRSSAMEGSMNRTPVSVLHQGPNQSHSTFNDLNAHLGCQTSPNFSHHPNSRPLSGDMSHLRSQTTPGNASPLSQVHEQGSEPEELRVECTWDKACGPVKLDLNAPAENFLITLENKFKRFKKVLDRNTHSIRFANEKETEGGYGLALEESNFVDDWDSAVDWIRENRRTKPPHLYAVIELEEG